MSFNMKGGSMGEKWERTCLNYIYNHDYSGNSYTISWKLFYLFFKNFPDIRLIYTHIQIKILARGIVDVIFWLLLVKTVWGKIKTEGERESQRQGQDKKREKERERPPQ